MEPSLKSQFSLEKAKFKAQLELKKEMHKGKDGYTPVKGKDYFTKREIAEIVRDVQSLIRVPEDGKDAVVDYEKILRYTYAKVAEHVAKLPVIKGDKGDKGEDGKDAVVDLDELVRKVITQLPKQKDKKFVIDRKQIEELIDERVNKSPKQHLRIGGSVASIRALTDVDLTGVPQDAQGNYLLAPGSVSSIAGFITAGTNVTITGSGTLADPYVISSSGGGGGGSGITRSVVAISTPTTAGAVATTDYVYLVTNTTLTLPTAVGNTNRYTVKCVSGTCVVDGHSSETIDGTATITFSAQSSVDLISDGTNFNVI